MSDAVARPAVGLFRRPDRWWARRVVNPLLGPPPQPQEWIALDPAELRGIRSWWPVAVPLALLLMITLGLIGSFAPWATTSAFGAVGGPGLQSWTVIAFVVLLLVLLTVSAVRRRGNLWHALLAAALFEEQWFRAGSERWSWRRRVAGCVAFSVAHVTNLIITVAGLGALVLAGAVFMAIYGYELRRTGDRRIALLSAAKAHAVYNATVLVIFAVLVAGIGVLWLLGY